MTTTPAPRIAAPGAWPRPSPPRWTNLDAGTALREAERACVGLYGPVLTRTTDGWEATAVAVDGRRFRVHFTSGVVPTPDQALELLAERVGERER